MTETGLEYLERLRREGAVAPMHELFGIAIRALGDGHAEITAVPDARFYNHQARVHGGFLATVIDSGLGIAVQTKIAGGTGYGTIELKINYVRKLDAGTRQVICTANVLHAGRTMLTAEARVAGPDGKLYAHGSGTFLVYPA
jgi:uncharacterized protein (TIGR00369 family)